MEEPESNTTDPSPAGLISNTGRGPKAPSTLGRCPPASRDTPSSISLPPPPCPGGGDGRVKPQVPAKQVLAETASGAPLCPLPLSISLIPGQERGASPLPPDEEQSWRKPGWGPHPWAEGGMLGEWVEGLGGGSDRGVLPLLGASPAARSWSDGGQAGTGCLIKCEGLPSSSPRCSLSDFGKEAFY